MPIHLPALSAPFALDFPQGVKVTLHPLTQPLYQAAHEAARQAVEAPEPEDGLGGLDMTLESDRNAGFWFAFLSELAVRAFISWEGVLDEADKALPCAPSAVRAFMAFPGMAEALAAGYLPTYSDLVLEGNGSRRSANGNSAAAGAAIAKTATRKTSPARKVKGAKTARSAPTGSTA